jgi:IclR family transcriptional regulator, pca regulon regulatory protein
MGHHICFASHSQEPNHHKIWYYSEEGVTCTGISGFTRMRTQERRIAPSSKKLRVAIGTTDEHHAVTVTSTKGTRPEEKMLASSNASVKQGDPNFMTSLARGLAVIRAFSDHRDSLTVPRISELTGLSRATVRRCLYTLSKLGYVASDQRSFKLEPKILELGHAYLSSKPLATAAQPILDRLCHAVHESCSIAVLEGDDVLYVARAAVTLRILSIDLGVGSRLPAYCTSMGRILLAYQSEERLQRYLGRAEFPVRTKYTITSPARLADELTDARKKGYCIVDQELEMGLRSIAAPVFGKADTIICAINVGTHAARVPITELRETIYPRLRAAAEQLSAILRQNS